jgi:hypothetical protein
MNRLHFAATHIIDHHTRTLRFGKRCPSTTVHQRTAFFSRSVRPATGACRTSIHILFDNPPLSLGIHPSSSVQVSYIPKRHHSDIPLSVHGPPRCHSSLRSWTGGAGTRQAGRKCHRHLCSLGRISRKFERATKRGPDGEKFKLRARLVTNGQRQ